MVHISGGKFYRDEVFPSFRQNTQNTQLRKHQIFFKKCLFRVVKKSNRWYNIR